MKFICLGYMQRASSRTCRMPSATPSSMPASPTMRCSRRTAILPAARRSRAPAAPLHCATATARFRPPMVRIGTKEQLGGILIFGSRQPRSRRRADVQASGCARRAIRDPPGGGPDCDDPRKRTPARERRPGIAVIHPRVRGRDHGSWKHLSRREAQAAVATPTFIAIDARSAQQDDGEHHD